MVLLRLGPFIDAEYDFGGLPAWLLTLRDPAARHPHERSGIYGCRDALVEDVVTNGAADVVGERWAGSDGTD